MSKYTYESVSAVNIDVNNKGTLEVLTAAAKINPTTFAESRLSDKTPEQQANILYSAVRDLGGNLDHPIVKAISSHMEKVGISTEKIQDVVKQGKDYVTQEAVLKEFHPLSAPEKPAPKKPVAEEILDPNIGAPILKEGYDGYKHVKVIDEQNAQKKAGLENLAETNPAEFAKTILKGKTPEQQADILFSAALELEEGNHPIVKALSSQMKEANIASDSTPDSIALAGSMNMDGLKAEKTLGKKVSSPVVEEEIEFGEFLSAPIKEPPLQKRGSEPRLSAEEERAKLKAGLDKLMPEYIAQAEAMKPKFGDKNFAYQRVEVIPEQDPVKKEMREAYAKKNPDDFAEMVVSGKTKEQQANLIFSAKLDDKPTVSKAIEDYLIKTKVFTPEEVETIKEASELERVKIAEKVKLAEQEIGEIPNTRPRSSDLTGPDDPRAPGKLAQDSVIFGGETVVGPKTLASSGVGSSEVDPITEAIRKEILAEQQKLLKKEIAVSDPSVTAMTPEKFREYLVSEKGKEEAAKVFAKPEMQTALNKIEVDGYKEVHNKFRENFQNVVWSPDASGPDQPKTKSCDIPNDAGQVVATIKETTHDKAPIAVTLDNGKSVQVNSYRTIEFPVDNKGKGPLHLSMAVKDENGKNIAEKDAVYFTAHYDDNGKLTEVSSPVPVKFMGKGDDAVGYIERNGKVYTLPVTQGNYKEMMREVAKNKGMGVDLSQEVDKPSQDLAITKTRTVEPVLEKEKVELAPKAKEQSTDAIELPKQETVPIPIVLKSGLTGAEKTQQIDTALKGATPDQIVATLKDQVTKGGSEVVGLIVEATKPDRTGSHPDVPKLTPEQFKEVYDVGMKGAKAIGEAPPKSTALNMTENLKLNGIQRACGKLAPAANIDPTVHSRTTGDNVKSFATKSKQHSI
jgi:hypothetical protein